MEEVRTMIGKYVAKLDEKNILTWETALQMMMRNLERWPMTSQFAP